MGSGSSLPPKRDFFHVSPLTQHRAHFWTKSRGSLILVGAINSDWLWFVSKRWWEGLYVDRQKLRPTPHHRICSLQLHEQPLLNWILFRSTPILSWDRTNPLTHDKFLGENQVLLALEDEQGEPLVLDTTILVIMDAFAQLTRLKEFMFDFSWIISNSWLVIGDL